MTIKRHFDHVSTSPHPGISAKRMKTQDLEPLSMAAECFATSTPTTAAYDFPDFTTHDPTAYPFFEFLGTGSPADSVPITATTATTATVPPNAFQFQAPIPASTVVVSPISAVHKPSSAPQYRSFHNSASDVIPGQPDPSFDANSPDSQEATDSGHNSDSTNPDSSSGQRQADRAARNRESSRRAREKAKGRLRALESEVLVLREHCRRLRAQTDAVAKQRASCAMCGFETPHVTSSSATKFPR
jgi:hypothetical protein